MTFSKGSDNDEKAISISRIHPVRLLQPFGSEDGVRGHLAPGTCHLAPGTWHLASVGGEDEVRWQLAPDGGEDGGQHGDGQGAPGKDQRVSGQDNRLSYSTHSHHAMGMMI